MSFIIYEDDALVVLDKPAGCSSEEGVPQRLREQWGKPDAYVGVIHRLDTGVSGLMVYAKTPQAAAALSRQVTRSQEAYAVQDGRAEGTPAAPRFIKQYRAVIAGGPDEALPAEGTLRDHLFKDSRKGRVFPVSRPRKGVKEAVLEYRIAATAEDGAFSLADITLHTGRTHPSAVCLPEASALGRWQVRRRPRGPALQSAPLWGDGKSRWPCQQENRGTILFDFHCAPERTAPLHPSRLPARCVLDFSLPLPRDNAKASPARRGHQTAKTTMEQQYGKTKDAEIYEVLEREIIDLTIRPGSSLSENPLCARFGAPRTLIRVVLQKLQENGLVKIVPYKGTTVTRLNREIVDELIYERTAVEARVLRDFAPHCTPEQRALIRRRADAYAALAQAETPDYNRLYEADRLLHETWFAAMGKMYLFRTLQNAHADYSRFRMLDTITSGGLAEVIADHQNLIDAIERCDLAAFEPLVERHLYGGIRRLGSRLTEEYADYFE